MLEIFGKQVDMWMSYKEMVILFTSINISILKYNKNRLFVQIYHSIQNIGQPINYRFIFLIVTVNPVNKFM